MIFKLKSFDDLLKWWHFLLEGLSTLNCKTGARADLSAESFLQVLLRVVGAGAHGFVAINCSKNGKPLAYVVTIEGFELGGPNYLNVWAAYSNGKNPTAMKELIRYVEVEAERLGFSELRAHSRRINGSAMRLFERIYGFRAHSIAFRKEL